MITNRQLISLAATILSTCSFIVAAGCFVAFAFWKCIILIGLGFIIKAFE